ncbi:MAG TPA: hypothetical protein VJS47_00485 [Rhizomicrobium sp.]|nr:hypothetical protein [Rhizomicrobium sp.]
MGQMPKKPNHWGDDMRDIQALGNGLPDPAARLGAFAGDLLADPDHPTGEFQASGATYNPGQLLTFHSEGPLDAEAKRQGILDGWQPPGWSLARSGLGVLLPPETIAQIDLGDGQRSYAAQAMAGQTVGSMAAGTPSAQTHPMASTAEGAAAGSAPQPGGLTASGTAALTRFEGDSTRQNNIRGMDPRTRIYPDSGNRPTFGIGHLMTDQDNRIWAPNLGNMTLEQQQQLAQDTFRRDVERHRSSARDYVGHDVFDALTPNQQDALIIAEFNGGRNGALGPNMRRHIREGALDLVANDFDGWHETVNGARIMNPGLVRRQLETRAIWNDDYRYRAGNREVGRVIDRGGY